MGSYLLLASDARTVEKRRGRNSRKVVRPSRWGCPEGQGEAMAIDQVDRRVVSERPTVTSREAARGATAPAVTSFTKTYRTTAKIIGAVYLAGFVVGLVGSGIFQSILGATGASANLPAVAASSALLPRPVAGWGLIGYAILFVGMLSEVMGSGLGLASSIPGGLWEVFVGVWLIAKGFSSSGLAQLGKDASPIDTAR